MKRILSWRPILVLLLIARLITAVLPSCSGISNSQAQYCINANEYDAGVSVWQMPQYMAELKGTGSAWIRMDISSNSFGDNHDYLVSLKNNGFKILGVFGGPGYTVNDLNTWRTIVDGMIANCHNDIDAIEVWNEPDVPGFWSGYMDGTPEHYFDMLKIVNEEVAAEGMNLPILAGSIGVMFWYNSTLPSTTRNYGATFLQRLKDLGADSYCYGYSFHCYGWFMQGQQGLNEPGDVYKRAKSIVGSKQLWMTEMGEGSSLQASADKLQEWFVDLGAVDCPFICWYCFYSSSNQLTYSMMDHNFNENPSYTVFKGLALRKSQGFTARLQDLLMEPENAQLWILEIIIASAVLTATGLSIILITEALRIQRKRRKR